MSENFVDGAMSGPFIEHDGGDNMRKNKPIMRKRSAILMSELLDRYKPNPSLAPDHAHNILARIYPRMNELGIPSERNLGILADEKPELVRSVRRQVETDKQVGISVKTLHLLAVPLHLNTQWLQFGTGPREASAETPSVPVTMRVSRARGNDNVPALQVRGAAVVDGWFGESASPLIGGLSPPPADPAYPLSAQYALLVGDTSLNRYAQPGDFLIVLDPTVDIVKIEPATHLVVVSRTMKGNNLRELTVRRASLINGSKMELRFESTDSHFTREPLITDGNISIVGVVLAVYRRTM